MPHLCGKATRQPPHALTFELIFDSEASQQVFEFTKEYESGGRNVEYRNGEFEIRTLCKSDGYSFNVNLYGLDN